MNLGESLLAIGAMILLSVLVLGVNNRITGTGTSLNESKFAVLATSVGTSIIEEASNKSFDEATVANPVTKTSDLTEPNKLKAEGGETHSIFNDFDDYNGYNGVDSSMPSAIFNYSCIVGYVTPSSPDVFSNGRTWHKKIIVKITSPSMPDTIKLSSIYSYWYFR